MIPQNPNGAILITARVNQRWMTRLPMAQGAVYFSPKRRVFLSWGRFLPDSLPNGLVPLAVRRDALGTALENLLREDGERRLQLEDDIPLDLYSQLQAIPDIELQPAHGVAEAWREIKDEWEIAQLAEASRLTDLAFEHILTVLRPGMTELEVAAELERSMRLGGCEEFNKTIVATGLHSAKPHHWPTDTPLRTGDFVTMDYGCTVNGYHSDLTRTIVIGKATDEQKRIYATVLDAQLAAEEQLWAGRISGEMDAVARDIIEKTGYSGRFLHNLGHGIGLDIHEGTGLVRGSDTPLRAGMVVSVEPGIYVEGFGGVRIEDIAVVEANGCCVLEHSERALIEL